MEKEEMGKKGRGQIYLYTGDGEGKTLAALGLALRAVGHDKRVVAVQFMKGRKYIGEYRVRKRLAPNYEIRQFGREEFVDLKKPTPEDLKLAEKGIRFARDVLQTKPDLLILDEINLALSAGLVKLPDLLEILEETPEETTIILTGRDAPRELLEIADLVSEVREIRHPYRKGTPAREGLQY